MKGWLRRLDKTGYTELQLDVIKELANIGGGNAASSISKLIEKPVDMYVPTVELLAYEEVYNNIMSEDSLVNGILIRMSGAGEGVFLFIIKDQVSEDLVKMMIPMDIDTSEEMCHSAMKELVNIVVTSFLNAVSKMIDVRLMSSVPLHIRDMFGAILTSLYIEEEQYDDNIMVIKNEFVYQGDRLESSLYFVPRPGVLDSLFRKLGVGED